MAAETKRGGALCKCQGAKVFRKMVILCLLCKRLSSRVRRTCTSFVKHLSVTVICANTLFPAFFSTFFRCCCYFHYVLSFEDLSKEREGTSSSALNQNILITLTSCSNLLLCLLTAQKSLRNIIDFVTFYYVCRCCCNALGKPTRTCLTIEP